MYTKVTRRPISRRVTNIGIWNDLYDVISYLGIIFNAVVISISGDRFGSENFEKFMPGGRKTSDVIYTIQSGLLIVKFILSILIPGLPESIDKKLTREKLIKERERKKNSEVMARLSREKIEAKRAEFLSKVKDDDENLDFNNTQQKLDAQASILEDEETKNLKYYFENDLQLMDFEQMVYQIDSKFGGKEKIPKPVVKVCKVKKNNRKE